MREGGFAGKVLRVNLTSGEITQEPLDMSIAEKYIGGLGLCIKLYSDTITSGCDPLSPENPIVLGAGPLVGTNLPSTSRIYSVSKLPTSRTVGWCGAGGFTFGVMLKHAGIDHIIIEGRAGSPVYLTIFDDQVELRDASQLWGQNVEDTCELLWKEHGIPTGVLTIGQAGENLVSFSMAFIDRISTLGRGGFGAVMGSKNLKAVVVKGTGGVKVFDRKRYRTLTREFFDTMRSWPHIKQAQEMGMVQAFPLVSREDYLRLKKRRVACVSCPIGCKDVIEIPDGPFQGLIKCTSSAINLFTPMLYGFKDHNDSIKCMTTIDSYGLDMFEFFGVMSFVKRLVDNGLISKDAAKPDIRLDSLESMEIWAKKISLREGLGDIIAGGFNHIIEAYGEDSKQFAPALIKGMHPYAGPGSAITWDRFGTMELGQVLEPRGPHVGSGGSPTYFAIRSLDVFPKHLKRMGVPEETIQRIVKGAGEDQTSQVLNIGALLRYSHAWFTMLGSMGICARGHINRFYNAELCAQLYEAVTGISTNLHSLRKRVDRVWSLYRLINLREGLERNTQENPPEQWFITNGFKDYLTGEPLTTSEAQKMIEDYYAEWGWDPKTGVPSELSTI
jgi:aldehyde:ferredoxin oxidoreductase